MPFSLDYGTPRIVLVFLVLSLHTFFPIHFSAFFPSQSMISHFSLLCIPISHRFLSLAPHLINIPPFPFLSLACILDSPFSSLAVYPELGFWLFMCIALTTGAVRIIISHSFSFVCQSAVLPHCDLICGRSINNLFFWMGVLTVWKTVIAFPLLLTFVNTTAIA